MLSRSPDRSRALENVCHICSKVLVVQVVVVLPEDKVCGHVSGEGADSRADVDRGPLQAVEALAKRVHEVLDHMLFAYHIDFREKGIQRRPTPLVQVMVH